MRYKLIESVAKSTAFLINNRIVPIEVFRQLDFKGKLTISSYIAEHIYPNDGMYECRNLLFDISFSDDIQKSVYLNLFEAREIDLIKSLIRKGDCCIDVGANIGYFSLNMAKTVGKTGRVFAFEPDPSNFQKLLRNIALNDYSNISCFQLALSSTSHEAVFSRTLSSNSGWGRMGEWSSSPDRIMVRTVSLDEFIESENIQQVDFLKCDIEGHEIEFLRGAKDTLASGIVSNILIEYCGHELQRQGYSVNDYLELLGSYGYKPSTINLKYLAPAYRNTVFNLLFTKKVHSYSSGYK